MLFGSSIIPITHNMKVGAHLEIAKKSSTLTNILEKNDVLLLLELKSQKVSDKQRYQFLSEAFFIRFFTFSKKSRLYYRFSSFFFIQWHSWNQTDASRTWLSFCFFSRDSFFPRVWNVSIARDTLFVTFFTGD